VYYQFTSVGLWVIFQKSVAGTIYTGMFLTQPLLLVGHIMDASYRMKGHPI